MRQRSRGSQPLQSTVDRKRFCDSDHDRKTSHTVAFLQNDDLLFRGLRDDDLGQIHAYLHFSEFLPHIDPSPIFQADVSLPFNLVLPNSSVGGFSETHRFVPMRKKWWISENPPYGSFKPKYNCSSAIQIRQR
jgi:hypothetical protein